MWCKYSSSQLFGPTCFGTLRRETRKWRIEYIRKHFTDTDEIVNENARRPINSKPLTIILANYIHDIYI